jgi:hypothetical protein
MTQPQYGRLDVWQGVASIGIERARESCARLEPRARAADAVNSRAAYLDLLGPTPGERALDIGCGSGVVTRELAHHVALHVRTRARNRATACRMSEPSTVSRTRSSSIGLIAD